VGKQIGKENERDARGFVGGTRPGGARALARLGAGKSAQRRAHSDERRATGDWCGSRRREGGTDADADADAEAGRLKEYG
jgi:hypothetical protein